MGNDFVLRFMWCLICDSPHLSSLPLGMSISIVVYIVAAGWSAQPIH